MNIFLLYNDIYFLSIDQDIFFHNIVFPLFDSSQTFPGLRCRLSTAKLDNSGAAAQTGTLKTSERGRSDGQRHPFIFWGGPHWSRQPMDVHLHLRDNQSYAPTRVPTGGPAGFLKSRASIKSWGRPVGKRVWRWLMRRLLNGTRNLLVKNVRPKITNHGAGLRILSLALPPPPTLEGCRWVKKMEWARRREQNGCIWRENRWIRRNNESGSCLTFHRSRISDPQGPHPSCQATI